MKSTDTFSGSISHCFSGQVYESSASRCVHLVWYTLNKIAAGVVVWIRSNHANTFLTLQEVWNRRTTHADCIYVRQVLWFRKSTTQMVQWNSILWTRIFVGYMMEKLRSQTVCSAVQSGFKPVDMWITDFSCKSEKFHYMMLGWSVVCFRVTKIDYCFPFLFPETTISDRYVTRILTSFESLYRLREDLFRFSARRCNSAHCKLHFLHSGYGGAVKADSHTACRSHAAPMPCR